MALYLVFVDNQKEISSYRIKQGKAFMSTRERQATARQLIGDSRPYIYLTADDKNEIEDKLREAGFNSKVEFIQNFSKVN